MFGYLDKTPYRIYTSKQTFEKHVDLSLLSNSQNSHYVLITDFDRFMSKKTKHHGKKQVCRCCLQRFSRSKVLERYTKNYLVIYYTKSALLPEERAYINFQNFKRLTKASFIIYGDFEYVLIPSTEKIDFGINTIKYQDQTVSIYHYKLICVDERYSKPY